jgi:hypothetical protein
MSTEEGARKPFSEIVAVNSVTLRDDLFYQMKSSPKSDNDRFDA